MKDHLFVSSSDGALYDTRNPEWSKLPALRPVFQRTFQTIGNAAELKATLRNGPYAWPGGYPLYFITSDGAALSFKTVRAELRHILPAITERLHDGWRVVACDINYEDNDLFDDHTSEKIECAYAPDDPD